MSESAAARLSVEQVQALLDASPFIAWLGLTVIAVATSPEVADAKNGSSRCHDPAAAKSSESRTLLGPVSPINAEATELPAAPFQLEKIAR